MPPINQLQPVLPGQQNYQNKQIGQQGWGDWFKEGLIGKGQQYNQVPTQTPQGMQFLQQLLSGAGEGLQNPYSGFDPIEKHATTKFQSDLLPGLAERFTAMGGSGTRGSSDFAGALGGAASEFGQGLASLRSQYGLQNRAQSLREGQLGLTPQFETVNEPGTDGLVQSLLRSLLPGFQSGAQAFGQQAGQFAGNKSFGQQNNANISQLLMQLLPLLGA